MLDEIQNIPTSKPRLSLALTLAVAIGGCVEPKASKSTAAEEAPRASNAAPGEEATVTDGRLKLPPGFASQVFAKDLGRLRHIAIRSNGDVYANLREPKDGKGLVALRDVDRDGRADTVEYFSEHGGGTGVLVYEDDLYFTSQREVFRRRFLNGALVPGGEAETIVTELPQQDSHAAKSIAIDPEGRLYVNVGAPSNACQEKARAPGSLGLEPCPQLAEQGTIWRFSATKVGQTLANDGIRHATGLRNVVALAWDVDAGALYGVQHGRDQLAALFSSMYTPKESAELPAEEFFRLDAGFVGGWPYTYYDPFRNERMIAPEYGGDGKTPSPKGKYPDPLHAFPAHYAPNGLLFYRGTQFPKPYRGGAFVAFRGSWNRGDFGQDGYRVDFLPMKAGRKTAPPQVFADGFAGTKPLKTSRDARFRPMGLAEAPDGSLFISDTEKGWIWRIRYDGG